MIIPEKKISQTILEFGDAVIASLPPNHSKEEFESTMFMVITVWNSITIDSWNGNSELEDGLLSSISGVPSEIGFIVKKLIKRKKTKFKHDPRAIGNSWVRDNNGEVVFGCEARVN